MRSVPEKLGYFVPTRPQKSDMVGQLLSVLRFRETKNDLIAVQPECDSSLLDFS
jgi:hypothetical protein